MQNLLRLFMVDIGELEEIIFRFCKSMNMPYSEIYNLYYWKFENQIELLIKWNKEENERHEKESEKYKANTNNYKVPTYKPPKLK